LAGAVPVFYDLDENNGWAPDFSSVPEEVLQQAKLLWINYPHMPTGAAGNEAFFQEIIRVAKKYQLLVVNDNPYSMVLPEGRPVSILQSKGAKEVAIELNSLSKSHNMAGARVGMVVGGEDYINAILRVKSNVDSGMYLPIQEAAVAALQLPDSWHEARNAVYASRRKFVWQIMDALGCTYSRHQVGMFIWARIPDRYSDVEALTELVLHEAYVFITPGFIFGTRGERYVRISLCSPETVLQEAFERIKRLSL
jgi:aspartate/methionine/tyrosine aminotransferase